MKLFGQFLIEKNAVSKEDLVMALVTQIERSPSVPEIVFKHNIIPFHQLYEIFQVQANQRLGFVEAARELGCWSEETQLQVEKILSDHRPPIGEILVQMGATDLSTISRCLDEFLGSLSLETDQEVKFPSTEVVIESAITHEDSLGELSELLGQEDFDTTSGSSPLLVSSEVSLYCEKFDLDYFLTATSLIAFDQGGVFTNNRINEALEVFRALKGTARFSNLKRSEAIVTGMENSLNTVVRIGVEKVTPDLIKKLESYMKKYLEMLWDLREDLRTGLSEDQSLDLRNFKDSFKQLTGQEI